jgi:hypothetical protein
LFLGVLNDLERSNAGNVPYWINYRQSMHNCAVCRDDEIGGSS